jgi:hypothetical protein
LSYEGELLTIRWCVRLRAFLRGGREACLEHPFRLGNRAGRERLKQFPTSGRAQGSFSSDAPSDDNE